MKSPTLTVCLTINERTIGTLNSVFASIADQPFNELVVVLDAPKREVDDYVRDWWDDDDRADIVTIARPAGWICPAKAWNTAFDRVSSELIYCISSETTQARDNIETAKRMLATDQSVLFGKAECSCGKKGQEVTWTDGAPGNLLCDSKHPRPLGFIWAGPMWAIRRIGGFDEEYMKGYWFDDDDFFYRMWETGLDFVFTDDIAGVHLHHDRPGLTTAEGQRGIQTNRLYTLKKWGSTSPMATVRPVVTGREGMTRWGH